MTPAGLMMNTRERMNVQTMQVTQTSVLRLLLVLMLTISTAGCANEPALVSITAVTFNYSQEDLLRVSVNGKSAGSLVSPAKLGEVEGGGKYVCCIALSPAWESVEVLIRSADKADVVSTYATQATVRQPWPKIASYAVFHVLPGRKVVIEVVPAGVEPDMELLAQRIKELGLKP
jgi:hypothetical protein